MIGVYKRALRLALELHERGHEIVFFCTGREFFHDSLTEKAEQCMQFIDIPFFKPEYEGAEKNREIYLSTLSEIRPDIVVIGEAPMVGPLLETTLSAAELNIPIACLDNAYQPFFVQLFWENHGPMFDGIILNGPSSLHWKDAPPQLLQVPPFLEASVVEAEDLLKDLFGQLPDRLVTVLAYDLNVARMATSLFKELSDPSLSLVYIGSDIEKIQELQGQLPAHIRSHICVIQPPSEPALFGLIKLSKFAVTKCAYMQVTECLSLGTPVIGYFYPGYFPLNFFPNEVRRFVYVTDKLDSNREMVAVAKKYLNINPEELLSVHNGELSGLSNAADFLEDLPRLRHQEKTVSAAQLGFSKKRMKAALRRLDHTLNEKIEVRQIRSTRLRFLKNYHSIYSVLCDYSVGGEQRYARLWGHTFPTLIQAILEIKTLLYGKSRRQFLYFSPASRILIELDMGVEILPSYLIQQ
jgi:hypothetical protein